MCVCWRQLNQPAEYDCRTAEGVVSFAACHNSAVVDVSECERMYISFNVIVAAT
jgi:hypothetical protein